jgi:hypothetical protein
VDAIVNATNKYLEHGAGVAGAIVRRGEPVIQAESSQWVRDHGLITYAEPAYTSASILDFIDRASNSCLKIIRLVLFDQETFQVFLNA